MRPLIFSAWWRSPGSHAEPARTADRRAGQDRAATHTALGFTDGFTHTEIKLSSRGLRVIEVNARL
ncbi:hypothetical protein ABZ260_41095, partial [Streptosporangium sp. NPDC006013]|uniref:hypothetical protein n=1 Tax=Streptosporangium sp. NPDC006013 TaxID=3155596 RepID=UPI0033AAA27D